MEQQVAQPEAVLGWLGSLADPTRLRLLRLLERHELGVTELCDVLQLPQSTVSRHLKVLGDLGWVRNRRQGTNHLYRTILDELDPSARRIWLVTREQTERWATVAQDQVRLERRLQERSASQSFFAGAAGEWDTLRQQLYGGQFSTAAGLALISPTSVVADLGCGTGQISQMLSPFVDRVIAVDNSTAMLKAARRRLGEDSNVDLRRGELDAIPINDGECDAALMTLVLTYVGEPANVVREMGRVLKNGGRGVIVDLLPHDREDFRRQMNQQWRGFEIEDIRRWMTEGGFNVTACRALPAEPNVKGPALFLAAGTVNR